MCFTMQDPLIFTKVVIVSGIRTGLVSLVCPGCEVVMLPASLAPPANYHDNKGINIYALKLDIKHFLHCDILKGFFFSDLSLRVFAWTTILTKQ